MPVKRQTCSRAAIGAAAIALLCSGVIGAAPERTQGDETTFSVAETDAVLHDMCDKTAVLLGEPPVHGFGKALDFKVALTRRLIGECRFTGFFIESGAYDFLKIRQRLDARTPISAAMIEAAIGGIWANQETARLIPDLLQGAQSGRLRLGGLDDQLSRGTYAQRDMPGDLARYLNDDARTECQATLERHTQWQYADNAPYGPADTAKIMGCLDRIEAAALAARAAAANAGDAERKASAANVESDLEMVANFKRLMARDIPAAPTVAPSGSASPNGANAAAAQAARSANDRDRSMFLNFQRLMAAMPPGSKVIVWTATTHAAKDLSGVPGNAAVSMGSFIHDALGARAFALGFSEYSGSYAFARQPPKTLDAAPADSLEGRAFAGNELALRYFDRNALRALGAIAARPLGVTFKTAKWDDVLDGLVVFREEHPPTVSGRTVAPVKRAAISATGAR